MLSKNLLTPAQTGAALLDKKFPDWAKKIDVRYLNMASAVNCVLGQLYGTSENGCAELGGDNPRDFLFAHGFMATPIGGLERNLEALKADWCACIERRVPSLNKKIEAFAF